MIKTRRLNPAAAGLLTLVLTTGCASFYPDPAGTHAVFVKEVPAKRLAVIERPGKSYFSIGKDLDKLRKSGLFAGRTGPLEATYYVDSRKEKDKEKNSDAALPVSPRAQTDPFKTKDVPARTVAYAFWRQDYFRAYKVIPSIEAWAEKNGWKITGSPTEIYISAFMGDEEKGENVVEVQIPVERK